MANTFILGGSPLGLIGPKSRPTKDNMSTFNGGESRNINVLLYNTGDKQDSKLTDSSNNPIKERVSLFTGGSIPNFWANISDLSNKDATGLTETYNGINRNELHNDNIYDTSILNIIERLSFSNKAALRPQDFAYLKNLGVYPNNRLMIARRFPTPMRDNIMDKGDTTVSPLSVLISWKPENEDFLEFSFGEKWEDAEADFTTVLNDFGGNFNINDMGKGIGKGIGAVPLPGFTELLQRKLFVELGIFDAKSATDVLPSGNPNIIKMAKRRKIVQMSDPGSGLTTDISIKMVVEYEQKFISGIDPTIAWMDIMSNALAFGTSNSDNYGLSESFAEKLKKWTGKNAIDNIITDVSAAFKNVLKSIDVSSLAGGSKTPAESNGDNKSAESNGDNKSTESDANKTKNELGDATKILTDIINLSLESIEATIRKYQVKVLGIAAALSGIPSTPWHITIGNPLRPIFVSGDMLVENVNIKLGPTLSFNDLPSSIKIEFTMKNARPWGLQEILSKFNNGYLRTVNVRKDFMISNLSPNGSIYYTPIKSEVKTEEQS